MCPAEQLHFNMFDYTRDFVVHMQFMFAFRQEMNSMNIFMITVSKNLSNQY